jgi:hypothetical protein
MPRATTATTAETAETVAATVPDIGDTIAHHGHGYNVKGWMRRAPEGSGGRPTGPDRVPLVFCLREDAEYVHAQGHTGETIARVADVRVIGRALWIQSTFAAARRLAADLAGQPAG